MPLDTNGQEPVGIVNFNDYVYYDEQSPTFLRRIGGKIAGCLRFNTLTNIPRNSCVNIQKKQYYTHRVVWNLFHGQLGENLVIDHLDGNPHNNKIDNLRAVCVTTNSHNVRKMSHNTSGITGVVFSQSIDSWRAVWHEKGKQYSRSFSVSKYGYECAKNMAIAVRNSKIDEAHIPYTDRHGR